MPGKPRRIMQQSKPGVRRRRLSQPSIHLPRSVYLPSINTGALALSKFSLGAKKSSFATSTAPPTRSEARSIRSVKSIFSHKKAQKALITKSTKTLRHKEHKIQLRKHAYSTLQSSHLTHLLQLRGPN